MWKVLAALALGLALTACDVSGLVPQEHQDFAKRVVAMVQNRDEAGLQAVTDPSLMQQLPPDIRARMAAVFPNEQPSSITISSWKSHFNNGWSDVTMVMLYKYSRSDVEVNIGFKSAGQRNVLTMIYVKPINGPMPPPAAPTAAPMFQDQQQQEAPQDQQSDDKADSL